ncbi:MAG: ribose 1,5-bisphosphate isomerase, partial [archaeon]
MNKNIEKEIKKTCQDIKELKIQGATNVALEAVKSLKVIENEEELEESIQLLEKSRPTEPMMRNGLKYVKSKYKEGKDIKKSVEEFEQIIQNSVEKIIEIGSEYIPSDTSIMTHCHSSLVERIIKEANREGKIKKVVLTETRPRYQGRITAKKLAKENISVELGVDSARIELLKEVDLAIVGADLITSDGYLFNKIGTHELALSTHNMEGKNFLVAAQLL